LLEGYNEGVASLIDKSSGIKLFTTEFRGVAITSVEIAESVIIVG